MWNLLAGGNINAIYRPSTSTGTVTNGSYAYDEDASPWSTAATVSQSGSAVAGTPDNNTVVWSGFPVISKGNMSSILLQVIYSYNVNPNATASYFLPPAFRLEYSVDAGTSWIIATGSSIQIVLYSTGLPIYFGYPASDYSSPADVALIDNSTIVAVKAPFRVNIPPSSLSSGLDSIRVRATASTLKSTKSGNPVSSMTYSIWDIQAVVS